MKKLISSLAFTTTVLQVVVAQASEITVTFTDTDLTEIQQNICNSAEVNEILLTNQPDETDPNDPLVQNSPGEYTILVPATSGDDDDGSSSSSDYNTIVSVYSGENTIADICQQFSF